MDKKLKTYLNSEEREKVVYLAWMNGFLGPMLDEWVLSTEERKCLSYTKTYNFKFMQALFKRVGTKEADRMMRIIRSTTIALHEKRTAIQMYKKDQEEKLTFEVGRNEMDEIAEGVIDSWCVKCKRKDFENCEIRKMFEEAEVEKFNPYTKDCQYKVKIKKRGKKYNGKM